MNQKRTLSIISLATGTLYLLPKFPVMERRKGKKEIKYSLSTHYVHAPCWGWFYPFYFILIIVYK